MSNLEGKTHFKQTWECLVYFIHESTSLTPNSNVIGCIDHPIDMQFFEKKILSICRYGMTLSKQSSSCDGIYLHTFWNNRLIFYLWSNWLSTLVKAFIDATLVFSSIVHYIFFHLQAIAAARLPNLCGKNPLFVHWDRRLQHYQKKD